MKYLRKAQKTLLSYSFAIAVVVLCVVFFTSSEPQVEAQTSSSNGGYLEGYAWSDNVGWVQFNGGNHGVYVSPSDGVTLGGYAWSDNIGWVSFNASELSGCPSGNGACTARLGGTKPGSIQLAGWARALSADGNGWDGFIHLGHSAANATPPTTGQIWTLNGNAWGSEVVGWLNYNPSGGSCSAANCRVTLILTECNDGRDNNSNGSTDTADTGSCANREDATEGGTGGITATLTANPTSVRKGTNTMLSWSAITGATGCDITASGAVENIPYYFTTMTAGSREAQNLPEGNTTFSLNCKPSTGGTTTVATVIVRGAPIPRFEEI